jgi:predicted MFS family arabinose efflux permease
MSAIIRVGVVIGPFLTGLAWDLGGPWGAFGVLALWGAGLLLSCVALPAADTGGETTARFTARDLVPRLADYVTAFGLLALPVISVVMMVTVIRITGFAMQASFYAVYLEGAGYTGTLIGVLLSAFGAFGGVGALLMGPAARRFAGMPLLFVMVTVTIIAISLTPVLGAFWLLFIAAAANGGAYGLSQPLVITLTARGAGAGNQGKAVALRTTANRVAATFIPIVMGAVVEIAGLANAFYIIGGFFLVLLALVARRARSLPGVWHGTGP